MSILEALCTVTTFGFSFYLNQLGHTVAKQTGWAAKADLAGLK